MTTSVKSKQAETVNASVGLSGPGMVGQLSSMHRITTPAGTIVSYSSEGSGPALVAVHGAFSDHETNWALVKPMLRKHFTVHAVARRGRGVTQATEGHSLEEEARDVAAVIDAIGGPVFLLGHSYGAHCALLAATFAKRQVGKLVLYEAPWPHIMPRAAIERGNALAALGDWDGFAFEFFRDVLLVPVEELDRLRASQDWVSIVADARASLGDLRAVNEYRFNAAQFASLSIPVLLQAGSESPRDLYVTDALSGVLPNARIEMLEGQAHEGMTTAPELYAASVIRFLLNDSGSSSDQAL